MSKFQMGDIVTVTKSMSFTEGYCVGKSYKIVEIVEGMTKNTHIYSLEGLYGDDHEYLPMFEEQLELTTKKNITYGNIDTLKKEILRFTLQNFDKTGELFWREYLENTKEEVDKYFDMLIEDNYLGEEE